LAGFTNGASEPNESLGTATPITLPFVAVDGISAVDGDDLWLINMAADATLDAWVIWDAATDVDFYILDAAGATTCTSWYDYPEGTSCADGGSGAVLAGDVYININYYAGADAIYSLVVK